MFDVGFLEILVIGVVSLIVIGPERLPAVARTVGAWVGKTQRFVRGVKTDFANELKSGDLKKIIGDQNEQISELRNLVNTARKELKSGVDDATSSTRSSMDDFRKMISEDEKPSSDTKAPDQSTADTTADTTADSVANTATTPNTTQSADATKQSD
jgi:sec-independent protein translocase protein TatB